VVSRESCLVEGSSRPGGTRLLVVGAGVAQLGLLESAREHGLYVIAADRDPAAAGFPLADRRALISTEDEQGLDRLAAAEEVAGIVAAGIDFPVALAARIAAHLGLPHPLTPQSALLSTSKLRQRDRFAAAGVPHLRHVVCGSVAEVRAAAEQVGIPCVLKPPDRQGQRGLIVVDDPAALPEAFAAVLEEARGNVVLVEEHVPGPELTINAFSLGGRFQPLTVTDRLRADPPGFGVALAHAWPSELPGDTVAVATEAAAAAARALDIEDGPTYTQVLVGPGGPRVCELAARLGGGHDAELCRAALGVDLNGLAVRAAVGEPIAPEDLAPEPRVGGACVRFLVPPIGELEATEGTTEAASVDGVVWVRTYRAPGHVFGPLRAGADRAGAVLAVGGSRAEALERAGLAAQRVRFLTVEPAIAHE
jgi:biotin carboxylase